MKVKIFLSLILSLAAVLGVVLWGTTQTVRFDVVDLPDKGVVLNNNHETIQFQQADLVYRNWNSEQTLLTKEEEKEELEPATVLFFDSGNLLFTDDSPVINPAGMSENIADRTLYQSVGTHNFESSTGQKITEKAIVKLSNRQYFVPAAGTMFVDGVEVGTASDPVFIIDKTGSVTVFTEKKKKRYLGHFTFQIDANHIVDLSDEVYYANGTEIDLSYYGGTDNEKLVLTEESTTQQQTTSANEQTTAGSNQNGSEAATGAGSQIDNLPSIDDINKLNEQIREINKGLVDHKIPIIEIKGMNAQVTTIGMQLITDDPNDTLLGQLRFDVLMDDGTIAYTQFENSGITAAQFPNLTTGQTYQIQLTYDYDLGDGTGVKTHTVKTEKITTQTVKAIYQLQQSTSSTLTGTVQIDSEIEQINRANLVVKKQGAFGREETVQTISVDTTSLYHSGSEFVIGGLQAETSYKIQLVVEVANGEQIELNDSTKISTKKIAELLGANAHVSEDNVVVVDYAWESSTYDVKEVKLDVRNGTGLFPKTVATQAVASVANQESFIITEPTDGKELAITLTIVGYEPTSQTTRTFSYDVNQHLTYENPNTLVLKSYEIPTLTTGNEITKKREQRLHFFFQTGVIGKAYDIEYQVKTSATTWEKIGSEHVEFKSQGIECVAIIPHQLETQTAYRVVVYLDGVAINYTQTQEI